MHQAGALLGERHLPDQTGDKAMTDVEVGITIIELRVERIEQAEVDVVGALAEGRAQVVLGMTVGVMRRERQPGLAEAARLQPEHQRR